MRGGRLEADAAVLTVAPARRFVYVGLRLKAGSFAGKAPNVKKRRPHIIVLGFA
jgi:hypothetical protein